MRMQAALHQKAGPCGGWKRRRRWMRHRLARMLAAVALLGSTVAVGGGLLIATAGPASAFAGDANVCSAFAGTIDLSTRVVTQTYSDCHQQGSGTAEYAFGQTTIQFTIHWATGHATSDVVLSAVVDPSGGPCPAGELTNHVTLTVVHGAYAGSTGHNITCDDFSGLPIIHVTNFGPLVI
jgi:hypothetical protein